MSRTYNPSEERLLNAVANGNASLTKKITGEIILKYKDRQYSVSQEQVDEYNRNNDFCIDIDIELTDEEKKASFDRFSSSGSIYVYSIEKEFPETVKMYMTAGFCNDIKIKGDEK